MKKKNRNKEGPKKVVIAKNDGTMEKKADMSTNQFLGFIRQQLVKQTASMIIAGMKKDEVMTELGADFYTQDEKDLLWKEALDLIQQTRT